MKYYIFRNMTIESFFTNLNAEFSGYEDISIVDLKADRFIWFYLAPMKTDSQIIADEIRNYIDLLRLTISRISNDKTLITFTIHNIFSINSITSDAAIRDAVIYYNSSLFSLAKENGNIKVIDFSTFLNCHPHSGLINWKYYFISQMAINPQLAFSFQEWFSTQICSIELKRKKCLILDLDNTLWGGILGEDGIKGLAIGGDYPGNAFLMFQNQIAELGKQGVILCVCSKNNIDDVRQMWKEHPNIVLKEENFAGLKINWTNKADNIRQLAEELNIGEDSMVFIDDNPTERELIKSNLPQVIVPDFPAQPYMLPYFFKQLTERYFAVYSVTKEDINKTEQYKMNTLRNSSKSKFVNMESYIHSLEIELKIDEIKDLTLQRIAQMTQKTNQFNLTTLRYTDADIKNLQKEGAKIFTISVEDKFGDNGITGVCIIKMNNGQAEIDSLLLSCRILGKKIEDAFVNYLLNKLKNENINIVKARYNKTAKNSQVVDFYDRIGFTLVKNEDGEKVKNYIINLSDKTIELSNNYKYL